MKKTIRQSLFLLLLIFFNSCGNNDTSNLVHSSNLDDILELVPHSSDTIPFTMIDEFQSGFNFITMKGMLYKRNLTFLLDNGMLVTGLVKESASKINISKFQKRNTTGSDYYYIPNDNIPIYLNSYSFLLDSICLDLNKTYKYDGILGFEFFDKNIIEIDFKNRIIVVHNQLPQINNYISLSLLNVDSALLPEHMRHRLVKIDGFINHSKQCFSERLLLDLGSPITIFSPELYEKIDFEESKKDSLMSYILGSFNEIIGNSPLTDHNGNPFFETYKCWNISGVLGVDFFKQFHVFFDYPHDKLYLKPIDNE